MPTRHVRPPPLPPPGHVDDGGGRRPKRATMHASARAAAARVPHARHGRQPPPPSILEDRGGRRQHEQWRRLPCHTNAAAAQRMRGGRTRLDKRGGRSGHASQATVAAAPLNVARTSLAAAPRHEPDVGGGRHLTMATVAATWGLARVPQEKSRGTHAFSTVSGTPVKTIPLKMRPPAHIP